MSAAIRIRQDFEAATLRRLATTVKDAGQARWLLALAAVYDGADREAAARIGGMDRQTLRDWVHRFNHCGPDGLINVKSPGRRPKLSPEQREELRRLVEAGPDPEKDGFARWRCVDLKRVLGARFAHRRRVGIRHDNGGAGVAARADGAEQIGVRVTLILWLARTRALFGPLINE